VLGDKDAMATVAVSNIERAKKFYEGTLGLRPVDAEMPEAPVYQSGSTRILVYVSQFAGTNKATAVTWTVGDDIEAIVHDLKARGVAFEHYDMPGMTRKGDVHVDGSSKAAWLKDPDGNILALVNG
jgi:catechol 2,3-dioxygenase-like lactoylglutathione lyase family enzyme